MSRPKYQIFVSATYEDLKQERDEVMWEILKMGHIPVGMELFGASNQEKWNTIAKLIAECDYYVVIVAHRYGSLAEDGRSWTEKEYDLAVEKGVPVLGFVIDRNVARPPAGYETDRKGQKALSRFLEKVKAKRGAAFWRDATHLSLEVVSALSKAFNTDPRPGWVPASEGATKIAGELARLSSENAELRARLSAVSDGDRDALADIALLRELPFTSHANLKRPNGDGPRAVVCTISGLELLRAVGPHLLQPTIAYSLCRPLTATFVAKTPYDVEDVEPMSDEDTDEMLTLLGTMGLVDSAGSHPILQTPRWILSARGRATLGQITRDELSAGSVANASEK